MSVYAPVEVIIDMPASIEAYKLKADRYAVQYQIPEKLFRGLIMSESSWNPSAVSSTGATGLGQLTKAAASETGVKNRFSVDENLRGSAEYLSKQYKRFGNWQEAIAAYKTGPDRDRSSLEWSTAMRRANSVLEDAGMTESERGRITASAIDRIIESIPGIGQGYQLGKGILRAKEAASAVETAWEAVKSYSMIDLAVLLVAAALIWFSIQAFVVPQYAR